MIVEMNINTERSEVIDIHEDIGRNEVTPLYIVNINTIALQ